MSSRYIRAALAQLNTGREAHVVTLITSERVGDRRVATKSSCANCAAAPRQKLRDVNARLDRSGVEFSILGGAQYARKIDQNPGGAGCGGGGLSDGPCGTFSTGGGENRYELFDKIPTPVAPPTSVDGGTTTPEVPTPTPDYSQFILTPGGLGPEGDPSGRSGSGAGRAGGSAGTGRAGRPAGTTPPGGSAAPQSSSGGSRGDGLDDMGGGGRDVHKPGPQSHGPSRSSVARGSHYQGSRAQRSLTSAAQVTSDRKPDLCPRGADGCRADCEAKFDKQKRKECDTKPHIASVDGEGFTRETYIQCLDRLLRKENACFDDCERNCPQ